MWLTRPARRYRIRAERCFYVLGRLPLRLRPSDVQNIYSGNSLCHVASMALSGQLEATGCFDGVVLGGVVLTKQSCMGTE